MLTEKQSKLLHFISGHITKHGISPSFDEMKDALNLKSKSGIHRLIKALEERGFIRRLANRARALEVIRVPEPVSLAKNDHNVVPIKQNFEPKHQAPDAALLSEEMINIPLHGQIAAGTPVEALENATNFLSIPPSMMGKSDTYALEISGDSMIEMGIMDGDTVLIEKCNTAREGEVVVALIDQEEATLKTFRKHGSSIALVPSNEAHDTQYFEPNRVQVQGKLVGLIRKYH